MVIKKNKRKSKKLVSVPEKGLLSLVASKLRDRQLFPKKLEDAKKFMNKLKASE